MLMALVRVASGVRTIVSLPIIVILVLMTEILYVLSTTKRERRIDRMIEDVIIAGHGNPSAGAWLAEQYLGKLKKQT